MIESYVSVQRFCFKSLYVSTMCLIADMETIPQMKSAGTPEKSRLPALLGAGDERIELPLRVLETPVIPFDQSPMDLRYSYFITHFFRDVNDIFEII